ncbi:MAG: RdgB/HAM1 family non-canonical purine NTP pyrophosphatase [Patescibacteria group bacterium]
MKIVFATQNEGKLKEMKDLLSNLDIETIGALEAGVTEDVEEDGETLAENSLKKARFVSKQTGQWAVADDTGLFIEALGGQPGIKASRWVGEDRSHENYHRFTLEKIKDVPDENRGAYFETVVALVTPDGQERVFSGKLHGRITKEPRGHVRKGRPYDEIFQPDGSDKTFGEMTDEEKHAISHRGKAFEELKVFLYSL